MGTHCLPRHPRIIPHLTCGPGFGVPWAFLFGLLPSATPDYPAFWCPPCRRLPGSSLGTCSGISLPAVPWGRPACPHRSTLFCPGFPNPFPQGWSRPSAPSALVLGTSHSFRALLHQPVPPSSVQTYKGTLLRPGRPADLSPSRAAAKPAVHWACSVLLCRESLGAG